MDCVVTNPLPWILLNFLLAVEERPASVHRFGLHGYVAAYILPEGFQTNCLGVEYAQNKEAEYAVITVTEPMVRPFERIPTGYKHIMDFLQANNFKDKVSDNIIGCFEHEYEKEGVHYMDIYVHAASVTKVNAYSTFN